MTFNYECIQRTYFEHNIILSTNLRDEVDWNIRSEEVDHNIRIIIGEGKWAIYSLRLLRWRCWDSPHEYLIAVWLRRYIGRYLIFLAINHNHVN